MEQNTFKPGDKVICISPLSENNILGLMFLKEEEIVSIKHDIVFTMSGSWGSYFRFVKLPLTKLEKVIYGVP